MRLPSVLIAAVVLLLVLDVVTSEKLVCSPFFQ
jgi:hypothetical protein